MVESVTKTFARAGTETERRLRAACRRGKPIVLALFVCGAVLVPGSEAAAFANSEAQGSPATATSTYQAIAAVPPAVQEGTTTGGRYLIEDRLGHTALWVMLGLALLLAVAACDGGSPRIGRRLTILALSLAGVVLAALANDLVLAVLAMELASLPATVLTVCRTRHAQFASRRPAVVITQPVRAGHAHRRGRDDWTLVRHHESRRVAVGDSTRSGRRTRARTDGHVAARRRDGLCPDSRRLGCPPVCSSLPAGGCRNLRRRQGVGDLADGIVAARAALLLLVRLLVQGPLRLQGTVQPLTAVDS